ncbi:M56 family metallopeptidase [Antrihabitans sp. YC3-6]|uniref:M56 family metallopeptidase n=2 Tax=Antrihabitans stalagmiti TaxID=2799499 RepID=A0A934NTB7_9NOCA|nr:M56 family metallopeptidase [Antrihabitans stalagmiti]
MPIVLRRLMFRVSPVVALTAWLGTVAGLFVLTAAAVAVLAWPAAHAPAEGPLETMVRCLTALQHALRPLIGEIATGAVVAIASVIIARVCVAARRHHRVRTKIRDFHRDVVAIVARTETGRNRVMWLDHPLPMAYSIDGRPGYVVATEGLARCLTDSQQAAVIAHEHAHLRARHHRILSVCEVLAAALPRVPLLAAAPRAVETLIELVADHAAAQATSAYSMSTALRAVSTSSASRPQLSLGLLSESISFRLRCLDEAPSTGGKSRTIYAAAIAVLLPVIAAAAALAASAGAACLIVA